MFSIFTTVNMKQKIIVTTSAKFAIHYNEIIEIIRNEYHQKILSFQTFQTNLTQQKL